MILALKTDGATTEMRLLTQDGADVTSMWDSGRTLADHLLSRIENFLSEHHANFEDLKGIIIFSGPGSFTSLRIGHTVANALADGLGLPVVGASGENWLEDGRAMLATTPRTRPALPYYGSEAHITQPKT